MSDGLMVGILENTVQILANDINNNTVENPPRVNDTNTNNGPPPALAAQDANARRRDPVQRRREAAARVTRSYFWLSFYGALLAILTISAPPQASFPAMRHSVRLTTTKDSAGEDEATTSAAEDTAVASLNSQKRQHVSESQTTEASLPKPISSSSNKKKVFALSAAFLSPARRAAMAAAASSPIALLEKKTDFKHNTNTNDNDEEDTGTASISTSSPHPLQQLPQWLRRLILLPDPEFYHQQQKKQQQQQKTDVVKVPTLEDTFVETKCAIEDNDDAKAKTGGGWWQFLASFHPKPQPPKQSEEHTLSKPEPLPLCASTDEPPPPEQTPPPKRHRSFATRLASWVQTDLVQWLDARLWLDPTLLHPSPHTLTDLIDKILTSTPRLLAMANFFLALTYLLHSAVADWFLGGGRRRRQQRQQQQRSGPNTFDTTTNTNVPSFWLEPHQGREKMGGFLVFKLLLISAVVAPDTLDLLILLSWYTLLSFLRSLAHLSHHAIQHASAAGQAPDTGVLQLLWLVWTGNLLAACGCYGLFYTAGWAMVLLLTCDCALIATDVLSYILQHMQAVEEVQHAARVEQEELRHARNHRRQRERQPPHAEPPQEEAAASQPIDSPAELDEWNVENWNEVRMEDVVEQRNDNDALEQDWQDAGAEDRNDAADENDATDPLLLISASDEVDQHIQELEERHNRRVAIIDTTVFCLQLLGHIFTVGHFLHIWSLHGVQFTLIDGVLALHLHSAISSASKKIAQRRNLHRIARDLDGVFADATEMELRKAALAGDVCCVCLCGMTSNVKKVACGHLFHTSCLREVVERARTMEAARCPLCRASVLNGQYHNHNNSSATAPGTATNTVVGGGATVNNNGATADRAVDPIGENNVNAANNILETPAGAEDQALFRFSTEGFLPSWVPIPAFSFEVVRRTPAPVAQAPAAPDAVGGNERTEGPGNEGTDNAPAQPAMPTQQRQLQPQQSSFLRRLLVATGALPMSPEEETAAMDQLVDMFPQYDRADLLRELRERGSSEAVAESVLAGSFTGAPR